MRKDPQLLPKDKKGGRGFKYASNNASAWRR